MKKVLIVLVLLCSLFITACGGDENTDKVKIIDIKLTNEEYAFVCKKGNTELINDFNAFLEEIKTNGKFNEILGKYFEGTGEKQGYPITTSAVENTEDKFVIATNCPFEPFEYVGTDGLIYGIDIEIAALFAESQGLELVIKNILFDSILGDVDAGYSDMGMAGITITDDRLALYDFTTPYYQASQKLIVAADNTFFDDCETKEDVENKIKSLQNEKIGFQIGTTGNWYVVGGEWDFEGYSNVEAKGYSTAQLAIQDIINGQIYGVIVDEAPAEAMVKAINNA